jgi:hypothetical protein
MGKLTAHYADDRILLASMHCLDHSEQNSHSDQRHYSSLQHASYRQA